MKTITYLAITILLSGSLFTIKAEIIKVPSDFQTIALAVQNSASGDTIILSPGTYTEKNIDINKPLTISSEWKMTGDEAFIDLTIINPTDAILFSVNSDDVEISGLKIINGDHTLDINASVTVKYNHFDNNIDPVSMETGGGGYVGYNLIENNGDDGIDLDIGISGNYTGSDILIEHNNILNSNDDGIEIRLFTAPNQNIHYEIRHNTIIGSNNAGIQLISYDLYTGKVFNIHHNVLRNCKTGLGCMDGSQTSEDLGGALKMDERVYFYNNTSLENEMGATGGNNIIAINNIISGNTIGGFKQFGGNSVIANNLFYNNKDNNFILINSSAEQYDNIVTKDPLLDEITQRPELNSPCIDAGLAQFLLDEIIVIEITSEEYFGSAPDIGALENNIPVNVNRSFKDVSNNFHIRNYPNPFKLSTKISINLPQAGDVEVAIYDMTGRKILILEEGHKEKGMYTFEWSARDENGNKLPGGIYIAQINTSNIASNTRMLLLQ